MIFLKKHHRDIIFYKALCNLRSEAARTHLSFLWWIIEPLISMGIYYFIFGIVFQRGTEDYIPFLLVGLIVWQWFAQSVSHCSNSIVQNQNLIAQVDFPKVILPSINIVMDTFKFGIVFAILTLILWFMGYPPTKYYFYLPLIVAVQLLLNYACGIIVAVVTPYLPDLSNLLPHILRVGMYGSGILYSASTLPEEIQNFLKYNPMVWLIDSYRDILMYHKAPAVGDIIYYSAAITSFYILARQTINRLNKNFVRVLMQR